MTDVQKKNNQLAELAKLNTIRVERQVGDATLTIKKFDFDDATLLAQYSDLTQSIKCNACGIDISKELEAHVKKKGDASAFACPSCKEVFQEQFTPELAEMIKKLCARALEVEEAEIGRIDLAHLMRIFQEVMLVNKSGVEEARAGVVDVKELLKERQQLMATGGTKDA